jgi:hypothetical protein
VPIFQSVTPPISLSNSFKQEIKQLYVLRDLIPMELLLPEKQQTFRMVGA